MRENVPAREGVVFAREGEIATMHTPDSLEHVVSGATMAQQHWQARSRETAPAFTIAVAREAGAPGTSVAREVGRRLGWQVYDNELVQQIAKEHNLRASLLESLDERRQNWQPS